MTDKRDLKKEILDLLNNFAFTSRVHKRIAVYLVENWNEIPLMSIETLAKETNVSSASITRFARTFKFKGFVDFKEEIKDELMNIINPVERFKLQKSNRSGRRSLVRVAQQDTKNINKLLASIDEKSFLKVMRLIEKSDRVYTYGTSISSIFSRLAAYLFNQVKKETICLNEGDFSVEERIVKINKNDLLLFFSFFPYTKSTIQLAELAKQLSLNVIAISDNAYSPISECASIVLPIPRENVLFTTSTSALAVLINAIATEIALKNKDELTKSVNQEDEILRRFYYQS